MDKFRANLAKLEQTKKQLQHQVYITVMLAYFSIFHFWVKIRVMVLNATFNNISVISWLSVLLPECTEKTFDLPYVTDKLYHIKLYRVHSPWVGFEFTTSVVITNDCTGSCKSNYHMIMTTTPPFIFGTTLLCLMVVCTLKKKYFITKSNFY